MFDIVEDSWREFDRAGKPRLLCGCYYSVGNNAQADLEAYFHDYYPPIFPGPVEDLIRNVRTADANSIRDVVKRFEDIGCDEFIFQPIKADLAHLDGLAEIVF
jgi:hypothetical protein